MSQVKPSEVFGYLKLSPKYNVGYRPFPIIEADLDEGILVGLAENLSKLHNEHVIAHGPIGRKLAKWADETVATLLTMEKPVEAKQEEPVVEEEVPAPVEQPEVVEVSVEEAPVVEAPVEDAPVAEEAPKPVVKRRTKK